MDCSTFHFQSLIGSGVSLSTPQLQRAHIIFFKAPTHGLKCYLLEMCLEEKNEGHIWWNQGHSE